MKVKVRCRKFECRKDTGIYLPELVAKNAIPRPSAGSVFPIHTCYEELREAKRLSIEGVVAW